MFMRALGATLAIGLGLTGIAVGAAGAADDQSVIKLAIAIPIVVPSGDEAFLDAETLQQYTSEHGLLTQELDAVYDKTVALGIDPRIIASIRLLGGSAPASAIAWLNRLESASNQTFELAYADADLTLQTQGGSPTPLRPEGFEFAIDPQLFANSPATPTPLATGSAQEPSQPTLPGSEEILAWKYSLTDIAWPRENSAISGDLPAIAAGGYSTAILSSDNVSTDAAGAPTAQIDGLRVLVSNTSVSTALRSATNAILPADWDSAMATLSGSVADAGSGAIFATLDRTLTADGSSLANTIAALTTNPTIQLVPLTQVLAVGPTSGSVIDQPQAADRLSRVGQMIQAESAERAFASVSSDPAAITSNRRLELLALLSAEWHTDLADWPAAADGFTTESIALRNAVHVVASSNFLLVADNDQYLPITVDNGLNQAATVYITVRSLSPLLAIDDSRVRLDIDAGAQAKANIPVHSLSNGVVDVTVTLTSGTGVEIGAPISSEVNVQAGWETPIVIAIAILVVIVFGAGIVRTILRRRGMSRREADSD
ncbi:MAG: hypothetical protein KF761_14700 [Salinibacterium sp.]|nr:hypothetical protein [Salinibacterium sp.]